MAELAVIGNISRDVLVHTGHARSTVLGGAGLHIARAASAAGLVTAPVAVLGHDLAHLLDAPRFAALDWSATTVARGDSTSFTLSYDTDGELIGVIADYGVAAGLTEQALARIQTDQDESYHVCCRDPLHVGATLDVLTERNAVFSVDFIVSSAPATIAAAAHALPRARALFLNAAEVRYLDAVIPRTSLARVVISDGARPVRLYRHGILVATVTPPPTTPVRHAGAGDTLTGTFLAGLAYGLTDHAALNQAIRAASTHVATTALDLADPGQEE